MKTIHSSFLKNISYPFLVKYLNKNFWGYVKDYQKFQFESRDTNNERAENKIRKIITHAYQNVPFYRNSMKLEFLRMTYKKLAIFKSYR
jgi:phenylacetate-coenzyme A ligase PaaK-like adenylate-forming protein